ncbi:MAG: CaiB/BaiF CoA-transferase family protein [Rubrivivax sp.]
MNPLEGLRLVEFEGIGPTPMVGRILADLGAEVTLIARPQAPQAVRALGGEGVDTLRHGKRVVTIDLKTRDGVRAALDLVAAADGLIEGQRPGVMERLGLGPEACAAVNSRLVYARMTGWGQTGPLAQAAGHEINYVALSGMLSIAAHRDGVPVLPVSVLGDAGGALGVALGLVCGVLRARASGQGCVVDGAVLEVVAMLGNLAHWLRACGQLDGERPSPFVDSPFYGAYRCADGKFISLAAVEPSFYAELLRRLDLSDVDAAAQYDSAAWPALRQRFERLFAQQPQRHWCDRLEGSDACFAPVLGMREAMDHPHNRARGVFRIDEGGGLRIAPAPRFTPLVDTVVPGANV